MPWEIFRGSDQSPAGNPDDPARPPQPPLVPAGRPAWSAIPSPPPWRGVGPASESRPSGFRTTPALVEAVNAALHLRRPLLLTGLPGSGKSTLIEMIAAQLDLEPVLRWHVTSKSVLDDALFQYDALGRLQATQMAAAAAQAQVAAMSREAGEPLALGEPAAYNRDSVGPDAAGLGKASTDVATFVTLGPLGTALASEDRPRAVLIDEIDKSDLDLPGDLLNVLERGEFPIPPLIRDAAARAGDADGPVRHRVTGADREPYTIVSGVVRTSHFPVIVFTSNGERTFPPPFLRRCVSFTMPKPDAAFLTEIVTEHLGSAAAARERATIEEFAGRITHDNLAIDQLLNLIHLTTGDAAPDTATRETLRTLLLTKLSSR